MAFPSFAHPKVPGFVGWVERSETHQAGILSKRWVSLRSTHPTDLTPSHPCFGNRWRPSEIALKRNPSGEHVETHPEIGQHAVERLLERIGHVLLEDEVPGQREAVAAGERGNHPRPLARRDEKHAEAEREHESDEVH